MESHEGGLPRTERTFLSWRINETVVHISSAHVDIYIPMYICMVPGKRRRENVPGFRSLWILTRPRDTGKIHYFRDALLAVAVTRGLTR